MRGAGGGGGAGPLVQVGEERGREGGEETPVSGGQAALLSSLGGCVRVDGRPLSPHCGPREPSRCSFSLWAAVLGLGLVRSGHLMSGVGGKACPPVQDGFSQRRHTPSHPNSRAEAQRLPP